MVQLYVVGGFLGSGKTTALLGLTRCFERRGQRVALITNDLTGGLVDTATVQIQGVEVREISGGCFCCAFKDFLSAADTLLQEIQPDVILAEPVGSCVDLVATIVKPLRAYTQDRYRTMPLSVLVDPERLVEMAADASSHEASSGDAWSEDVGYLFERQMAEADVLVVTKIDTVEERLRETALEQIQRRERIGEISPAAVQTVSAVTGEGLEEWLETLDGIPADSDLRTIDLDSERYARAEAELGWVNLEAHVTPPPGLSNSAVDMIALASGFMVRMADRLEGTPIGHLKLLAEANGKAFKASRVRSRQTVRLEPIESGSTDLDSEVCCSSRILVNIRAAAAPDALYDTACRSLREVASLQRAEVRIVSQGLLRPGGAQPKLRIGDAPLR